MPTSAPCLRSVQPAVSCVITGCLIMLCLAADVAATPYWIHSDELTLVDRYVPSGRELIGQSLILAPHLPEGRAPRYDYRSLLTFKENSVEEVQAFGGGTYEISYEDHGFAFGRLSSGTTFSLRDDGDGNLFLVSQRLSGRYVVSRSHGFVRRLQGDEAQRFRAHLAATAKAEAAKRKSDIVKAGGGLLPAIVTYDYPPSARAGSDLIWTIYYGRFEDLQDRRLKGDRADLVTSQAIVVDALVSNLYRAYHQQYSVKYGASIREPVTLNRSDLVTRDGWGNEISRIEGHTFRIRSRFQEGYERSAPTTMDALGVLFKAFDSYDKTFDFSEMMTFMNMGEACSQFLDDYKAESPGTVAHFEENLERALWGRPPQRLDLPAEIKEVRNAPYRMPWEKTPSGLGDREQLADYGISWVRPAEWQRVNRNYGIAVYNAGFPETAQVIVAYEPKSIDDVLPYINLWREREDLAVIDDVGKQPMEPLEVDGRRGLLISFPGSTQVLFHDGPQSWIVTMYGAKKAVAARLGELREFVRSFKWHGTPNPPVEKADLSKRATATSQLGGRRSVRQRESASTDDAPAERVERPRTSTPWPNEAPPQAGTTEPMAATSKKVADLPPQGSPRVPQSSPAEPAPDIVLSADVKSRCATISETLITRLVQTSHAVSTLGRSADGCHLGLRWNPPLAPVVAHFRSALGAVGLTIDEDRTMPALGGRHQGRHFLRYSGLEAEGSVLIDEFISPPEVVVDLQLDAP